MSLVIISLHLKTKQNKSAQVQDPDFLDLIKSHSLMMDFAFPSYPLLCESCPCNRPAAPAVMGIRKEWIKDCHCFLALCHSSLNCFVSFFGLKKKNHTIDDMPTWDSLCYPPSGIAMKLLNQSFQQYVIDGLWKWNKKVNKVSFLHNNFSVVFSYLPCGMFGNLSHKHI